MEKGRGEEVEKGWRGGGGEMKGRERKGRGMKVKNGAKTGMKGNMDQGEKGVREWTTVMMV